MVIQIVWSEDAIQTYDAVIDYLQSDWTAKEILNFEKRVSEKLKVLILQPRLGAIVNKRHNIHRTLLHKQVTLFYRYKPIKKEIELLIFWNNSQNPKRLTF